MMNKSLRGLERESSSIGIYGFQRGDGRTKPGGTKKRAAVSGGF